MAPISVERCTVGRELTEPRLHPDRAVVVYAQSASGGSVLMWHPLDGTPARQLTSFPPPRAGRGMGGGCWCWNGDASAVVYAATDGNLWLQPVPGGAIRRLTDLDPARQASAPVAVSDRYVAFVVDDAEVWMVSLDGALERLDDGTADFCFDPCAMPLGSGVLWQAWNVPDMPWDHARVQRRFLDRGEFDDAALELGDLDELRPNGSIQQPRVMPDGTGIYVGDDHGWLNVWLGTSPLVDEPFEHAGPTWGQGQRSFAVSPDATRVAFTRNESGFGRLCVVDIATREVTEVARGVHGQLSWAGNRLVTLRTGARTPTAVVAYDTTTWERTVLAIGPLSGWEDEALREPELMEVEARDGAVLHARLHRADTATDRLLCWLHGGPTDQWQVTFMPRIAYWRSRGWNVLVPDHRGSAGHGREYQQAMRGRWGELDVSDTVDVIRFAQTQGFGAPLSTVVLGGSAGGFTALGVAASAPELLAGVVASYPVTDLLDLAERSHRFERHYTESLVGPLPAALAEHVGRSPVSFATQLIATPVLLLHGDADPVVPVEQSRMLAQRIADLGGTVELHVYPGEGHGFRSVPNQLDEYARTAAFLTRVVPDQ